MAARLVTLLLLVLLGLVWAQLLLGRGSVGQVARLKAELAQQNAANQQAQWRNDQLAHELTDLREGLEMVEERARFELGMVKPNELFVQVVRPQAPRPRPEAPPADASTGAQAPEPPARAPAPVRPGEPAGGPR